MIGTNLLVGKHVSLRAMEPEDLEILYTLENDTTNWDISSVNVPYSRYALKQFIAKGTHDIYTDRQLRLMIESVDDGTVVGVIDLVDFNPRHHRAELGIVMAKDYQNKGLGTEAIQLIEIYAEKFLELNQIFAYVSTKNESSIKLFEKCKYKHTCTLDKWILVDGKFEDVMIFQKIFKKK